MQESDDDQNRPNARSCGPPPEATPKRIHDLIQRNQQRDTCCRATSRISAHAERFVVAVDGRGSIVACGELAPLSHSLAEVRSLVVGRSNAERAWAGASWTNFVGAPRLRVRDLCVFAHQPAYFAQMGFSIVPHTWLPEKIAADCRSCALFRRCRQFAMVTDLDSVRRPNPRLTSMSNAATKTDFAFSASRGHHGARRVSAAGVYAGIKPSTQPGRSTSC